MLNSNLRIGYTLAMRDWDKAKQPYIDVSIASLRKQWFDQKIIIFAEPGNYKIEDKNIELRINPTQLWCFANYHNAASNLSTNWDGYILIMQDDFIMHDGATLAIDEMLYNTDFGYLCLSTPFGCPGIKKRGWNVIDLGRAAWCALYLMSANTMRAMIQHEFYQNHLHHYYPNKHVDACVSETILRMGKPMYYHNPSLATHIGVISSVWHEDAQVGMRYDKVILDWLTDV